MIRYTHETKVSRVKVVIGDGYNIYCPQVKVKRFYLFNVWRNVPVYLDVPYSRPSRGTFRYYQVFEQTEGRLPLTSVGGYRYE